MNNNNVPAILRSLIIYAICVPLAIFLGYSLANPLDWNTLGFYGVLGAVLASPILLRWHRELLVFSWSASILVFILPGKPNLWFVMVVISLSISILERIMSSDKQFIRVPKITWPLLAFVVVVIFTAELTGGIGIRAFGSTIYGGKKYAYIFLSVASYFALTARPIPKEKAVLYVTLFFAGRFTGVIGNLYPIAPSWMAPLFYVFPPTLAADEEFQIGVTRLGGFGEAGLGIFFLMMAKWGLRGVILSGKPWRILLLIAAFMLTFLGGYRTALMAFAATFTLMFFWEGLHRTPVLMAMILLGAFGITALIPMANKLPYTFQRTLAFLPLDLDAEAKMSADASMDWRLQMWGALLPQIPSHLLLGKGLAISTEEYDEMMTGNEILQNSAERTDASQGSLALASDYHNGMISLILPFGIWGVLTVLWFLGAGLWVMYQNAKYAPPELFLANSFLMVLFFWEAANFVSCVAGLQISSELASFSGYLGLSIALNNGVCRPAGEPVKVLPRVIPFRAMTRPRPAFQR